MTAFNGKVGLVQRVLPNYRAPFFNALGCACESGLSVFTGSPRPTEMIQSVVQLDDAKLVIGRNLHLFQDKYYLCLQLGLLDWLSNWNPDVLIVEANPRYLSTPAAIRWMHKRNRPVIGWGLGAPPLTGSLARLRRNRRLETIRQLDAVITYSQTGAEEYAGLGFPRDRIFIAVNAVTPPPKDNLPRRPVPASVRRARVLFVGRLQSRKRLDNLLQACASLPASSKPELVIVGDGPERANLESLAAEIYPAAVFTGAIYGETLDDQFKSADLFVLPGTGGLAIQQAMSFGLPVIAAEADGTQNDLVRPSNGWQVPPDDTAALTRTLEKALSNIAHLRRMGAESYRIVAEEVNLDRMVSVFMDAINRCVQ